MYLCFFFIYFFYQYGCWSFIDYKWKCWSVFVTIYGSIIHNIYLFWIQ